MLSCNPEHITTASCDLVLTLQHEHRGSCIVFSMLSCYRGEKAPEIYFPGYYFNSQHFHLKLFFCNFQKLFLVNM